MNHITCDDAFDILTTPGLSADPELAVHLQSCSRCQTMADTLAPALNLFRTAEPTPPGPSPNVLTAASLLQTAPRNNGPQEPSAVSRRNANQAMAGKAARRLTGLAPQPASLSGQPPQTGRRSWLACWGGASAAVVLACALISLNPASNETLPGSDLRACPRHSETTTEWMKQHHIPVNQACLACHPPTQQPAARLLMTPPQTAAFLLAGLPCCTGY